MSCASNENLRMDFLDLISGHVDCCISQRSKDGELLGAVCSLFTKSGSIRVVSDNENMYTNNESTIIKIFPKFILSNFL